jgi:hypothetical protein
VIRVAGIDVPRSSLTQLALRLEAAGDRDLAYRIGQAIDSNAPALPLQPGDAAVLLSFLADAPSELAELKAVLLGQDPSRVRQHEP